ncbi:DUF2141 domain-containing protein [Maribacter sp. HTCC2170]|uniref:DUF2141 domain-containing protein n=1 Tax=Maribacter sp. (strain HTCC2170 / KCCM 42371) TaxID=313603 RepID=UPI00006B4784|nr:DUF2141 domain-containing protein [Maribacter sp. HTCC2170]EAR01706.1 hypothetical protein FB2170_14298 [Maribacter sp. HTCC2170]
MKTLKTLIIIVKIALTSSMNAQETNGSTVTVNIENVLSDEGQILGALHTEETFMKGPGLFNETLKASKGNITLTFKNVQPGTFAIMLLHDGNENNRMDFEANGMPKEAYATSGEMELYGPPTFKASKFEVTNEDLEFSIRF